MKKRKIVSVLLAAMLTATVFAGCNNQGTESGTPSGDNPTSSAGGIIGSLNTSKRYFQR